VDLKVFFYLGNFKKLLDNTYMNSNMLCTEASPAFSP